VKSSARIAFVLSIGLFVGAFSVVYNAKAQSGKPVQADPAAQLQQLFDSLPSEQQEALIELVRDNNLSPEGIATGLLN
jgi:hypothetical protein